MRARVRARGSLTRAPHLAPLRDALTVDLRSLAALGGGVVTFRARQAYDDTYGALRYLVVTPTTLAAVAPHPTRLGIGVLKWERSLLSLTSLLSQPLFRPVGAGAGRGGAADKSAALLEADADGSGSVSFDEFAAAVLAAGMGVGVRGLEDRGLGDRVRVRERV